jgi:hypothetical protein
MAIDCELSEKQVSKLLKVTAVTAAPALPEPMKRVQPEQIAGTTLLPGRTQEFGASVSINIHC